MVTEITLDDMEPGVMPQDDAMHIVMFYGKTCGPCKFTMPNYEEAANKFTEMEANIKFYMLHAWENEEVKLATKEFWGVSGVPTFKIFCRAGVIHEKVGGGKLEDMMKLVHDGIDAAFKQLGVKI